jgi:hypothetical protein
LIAKKLKSETNKSNKESMALDIIAIDQLIIHTIIFITNNNKAIKLDIIVAIFVKLIKLYITNIKLY